MANTFTQMYAQIVFSPKGRKNLILPNFEERLYQYITGIIQERGQKLIAINGMPDHLHIFIGFKPTIQLADLVAEIKGVHLNLSKRIASLQGNSHGKTGMVVLPTGIRKLTWLPNM